MRNNRRAGHEYERKIATILRDSGLFPRAVTSRSCNRSRDNQGVDLVNEDEAVNGRMDFNIQCKNSQDRQDYGKLLSSMPQGDIPNVVLHRHTHKSGNRFMVQGEYAILTQEEFISLVRYKRGYEVLRVLMESQDEEVHSQFTKLLKSVGL